MYRKLVLFFLSLALVVCSVEQAEQKEPLVLWYDAPADKTAADNPDG